MSATNKQVNIDVGVTDHASKPIKDIGKTVNEVVNDAGGKGSDKGFLDRWALKAKELRKEQRTSGETALGNALKNGGSLANFGLDALGIGMPAMIMDQVGQGLAKVTGKILEMQEALRSGKANWADLTLECLKAAPVVGGFAVAGENINEMFTHQKQEANEAADAFIYYTRVMQIGKERLKEFKMVMDGFADSNFIINLKYKTFGKEGFDLGEAQSGAAKELALHQFDVAQEKTIEGFTENHKKRMEEIKAFKFKFGDSDPHMAQKADDDMAFEERHYSDELNKIKKEGAKTRKNIETEQDAEAKDRRWRNFQASQKQLESQFSQSLSANNAYKQEEMKFRQQTTQAELEQIKFDGEAKKNEIDRQLQEQLKTAVPEQRWGFVTEAIFQKNAVDATTKIKTDAAAEKGMYERRDKQLAINNNLADIHLKTLNTTADNALVYNDKLEARKQATRLELLQEFEQERRRVELLDRDKTVSQADKAKARAALAAYGEQLGKSFDSRLGLQSVAMKATADNQETWFGQGLAMMAQERADGIAAMVDVSKESRDFLKEIRDIIKAQQPKEIK